MSVPSEGSEKLDHDAELQETRLLRSNSKDEALEVAIKAAETAMQALKIVKDPNERARQSMRLKRLLQDAERIKHSKDWREALKLPQTPSTSASTSLNAKAANSNKQRALEEPRVTRNLSKSEQILLLKAGYLNGFKFPPWTIPPAPDDFELGDGKDLYTYVPVILPSFHQH